MGRKSNTGNSNHDRFGRSYEHIVSVLTQYIQLVIQGLRDAYLVDNCALTFEQILDICQSLSCYQITPSSSTSSPSSSSSCQSNCPPRIVLIQLRQDVIIVNRVILIQKLKLLNSNDWSTNHPFLINVDGLIPLLCTTSQINHITYILMNTLKKNDWFDSQSESNLDQVLGDDHIQALNFIETADFLTFVGFPFLAGWLLGYPCLYLSTQVMNALSAQMLLKISISIMIMSSSDKNSNPPSSSSSSSSSFHSNTNTINSSSISKPSSIIASRTIDIQTFTIPMCILDEPLVISQNYENLPHINDTNNSSSTNNDNSTNNNSSNNATNDSDNNNNSATTNTFTSNDSNINNATFNTATTTTNNNNNAITTTNITTATTHTPNNTDIVACTNRMLLQSFLNSKKCQLEKSLLDDEDDDDEGNYDDDDDDDSPKGVKINRMGHYKQDKFYSNSNHHHHHHHHSIVVLQQEFSHESILL